MHQISNAADKRLNEASRKIGNAEAKIAEGTAEKDTAWVEVVDTFGEFDKAPRFIANDGYTLAHEERNGTPKLDESMLSEKLKAVMDPKAFTRLWNSLTVKAVSPLLMEQARLAGKIPADIVAQCVVVPPTTFARTRRAWSKEDKEKVQIFGIQLEVPAPPEPMVEITLTEYEELKKAAGR